MFFFDWAGPPNLRFRWTDIPIPVDFNGPEPPNLQISMDQGSQFSDFDGLGPTNLQISMDWGPQIFRFRWTEGFGLDVFDGPWVSIFHFRLSRLRGVDWKSQPAKNKKLRKSRLILIWNSQKKIDWSWWGGSIENLGFSLVGLILIWAS